MFRSIFFFISIILPAFAMAASWQEYTSENFRVYSDAKPARVLQQVQEFEMYRLAVLAFMGLENKPENKHARIYIFDSDKEFREHTFRESTAGYYIYQLNGPAMVTSRHKSASGKRQDEAQNLALFHEYVHYLLRERSGINYPKWYDEGLSDLLGAAKIDKGKVGIGASNPWRHYTAKNKNRFKVEQLIEPQESANWRQIDGFYSGSWMLTHYLMLGHLDGEPNYAGKLQRYLAAYAQGAVKVADFEKIMGISAQALDVKLDVYARKGYLMGYSIPVKPYAGDIRQRKLSGNEMLYHKADLHESAGQESKAKLVLESNKRGKPYYFQNLAFHAIFLGHEGQFDRAVSMVEEALAAEGNDATVLANAAHALMDKLDALKKTGAWDEALYKRAHELGMRAYHHPDKTLVATANLKFLYEMKGDNQNAAKMMMEMYQVTPSRLELNYEIAKFLIKVGPTESAIPFLQKVATFTHDATFRNEVVELINEIKKLVAARDAELKPVVD